MEQLPSVATFGADSTNLNVGTAWQLHPNAAIPRQLTDFVWL
jgi:hypothetical protein